MDNLIRYITQSAMILKIKGSIQLVRAIAGVCHGVQRNPNVRSSKARQAETGGLAAFAKVPLRPGDRAGEAQVVRWCFAAMNSVEPPLLGLLVLDWTADGSCGKHREFLVGWANRVLTNLERWFADRDFVATKGFTVADILMAHVLSGIKDEALIAPYPGIASYRDRCMARPAWKRTVELYCARVEAG